MIFFNTNLNSSLEFWTLNSNFKLWTWTLNFEPKGQVQILEFMVWGPNLKFKVRDLGFKVQVKKLLKLYIKHKKKLQKYQIIEKGHKMMWRPYFIRSFLYYKRDLHHPKNNDDENYCQFYFKNKSKVSSLLLLLLKKYISKMLLEKIYKKKKKKCGLLIFRVFLLLSKFVVEG